ASQSLRLQGSAKVEQTPNQGTSPEGRITSPGPTTYGLGYSPRPSYFDCRLLPRHQKSRQVWCDATGKVQATRQVFCGELQVHDTSTTRCHGARRAMQDQGSHAQRTSRNNIWTHAA